MVESEFKLKKINLFNKYFGGIGVLHSGLVHLFWVQKVVRSNRTTPNINKKVVAERSKAVDCKSIGIYAFVGSIPTIFILIYK